MRVSLLMAHYFGDIIYDLLYLLNRPLDVTLRNCFCDQHGIARILVRNKDGRRYKYHANDACNNRPSLADLFILLMPIIAAAVRSVNSQHRVIVNPADNASDSGNQVYGANDCKDRLQNASDSSPVEDHGVNNVSIHFYCPF